MEDSSAILRPSLLSLQPARLTALLRPLGVVPRELALQAPLPTPLPDGWGVVPPTPTSPLVLDLVGMDLPLIAMLLSDLRQRQREQGSLPLILVSPTAVAERRMVSVSALSSVVIAANAPAETLARWVRARVRIRPGQVWLRVLPLALPRLDSHLIPLLAALGRLPEERNVSLGRRIWGAIEASPSFGGFGVDLKKLARPGDRRD